MMSLQTSTHSSQMNTVGPAMSLRTSFWSLLQKEQRSTSVSPFFLAMVGPGPAARPPEAPPRASRALADHIVNDTVFLRLLRAHDVVALGVHLDALEGLPRVVLQDAVQVLAHPQQLPRRDVDVGGLPGEPLHQRLVNHDARVGEREALALRAPRQQQRAHRRRL